MAEPREVYSFEEAISPAEFRFPGTPLEDAGEKEITLSDELLGQFTGRTCNTYAGALTLSLRDGMLVGYRYQTEDAREAGNFAEMRRVFSQAVRRFSI